jgi:hypothetical protein
MASMIVELKPLNALLAALKRASGSYVDLETRLDDTVTQDQLDPLSAGLTRTSDLVFGGAAPQTVTFNTVEHDQDWTVSAPPVASLTVPTAESGLYLLTASVVILATSNRDFEIQVDTARVAEFKTGATSWGAVSVVRLLDAGDVLELEMTAGSATTVHRATLTATRIG